MSTPPKDLLEWNDKAFEIHRYVLKKLRAIQEDERLEIMLDEAEEIKESLPSEMKDLLKDGGGRCSYYYHGY